MLRGAVFRCAGRTYTAPEVLAAAELRGEVAPIRARLRDALACEAYAGEHGYDMDEALLQSISDQYRKERGLASAAATEQWLAERGVELGGFVAYLERRLWHGRFQQKCASLRADYAPPEEDAAALLWDELVFSGALTWMAEALAYRAAAAAEHAESGLAAGASAPVPEDASEACAAFGVDASFSVLAADLEAAYAREAQAATSPEQCARELRVRWLDLMQVNLRAVAFPTLAMAQEAFLCLTEDGDDMASMAASARVTVNDAVLFVDALSPALRQRVLSASPGDILAPVERDALFWVYEVRSRVEPSLERPEVRQRVEEALLAARFDGLARSRVEWIGWGADAA